MDGQQVDDGLWLSISELARRKGKSKQAISKRVKRLRDSNAITVREEGAELKVNLVEFDRAVGETTDPAQMLRNPGVDLGLKGDTATAPATASGDQKRGATSRGYLAHKELSASYQAENARLDLEERLGKTCSKADVEQRTFNVFRRLRDRLLALPSTCAARVANATDERAVRLILDEEVRKVLEAMARALDQPEREDAEDFEDEESDGPAPVQ